MERIFCIYCKTVIDVPSDNQICPNCAEYLKIPQATLFNGVYIKSDEVKVLLELERELKEKIVFKGLSTNDFTSNEFEVNEEHSITVLKINSNLIKEISSSFNIFIDLRELKITSRTIERISNDFCPPNLEELGFFSCNFAKIPLAIFNCTKLKNLWISGSKIQEIPDEINNLRALEVLKLNNNNIKKIPHDLTLLNLTVLDLGCNMLDELPITICNLPNLTILKLHVNCLRYLPQELINLKNLQILELYSNFLTEIPKLPQNIHYLDLSSNFNLQISNNIEELKELTLLNIAGIGKVDIFKLKKYINQSSLITKLTPTNNTQEDEFLLK